MKEITANRETTETRKDRVNRASQFFEDHGLKRPEATAHETRGVGALAMEREATAANKHEEAAAREAAAAGKDKEAKEHKAAAADKQKEAKWTQAMGAINFNEPVQRKTIEPGTVLYRHEIVRTKGGEGGAATAGLGWFCGSDASPRNLGMVREGGMETGGNRYVLPDGTRLERKGFVATERVEALESTASDLCGFRPEDRSGLLYFGSDRQLCVSDRGALKPVEGMSLDEEIRLRLGQDKGTDGK